MLQYELDWLGDVWLLTNFAKPHIRQGVAATKCVKC